MVEGMSVGAVIRAGDGTILYANRSFAAMLDTPLDEVIGTNMDRFVLPEDMPRYETLIQHGGGASQGEIRLAAKGALVVPVLLSIGSCETGHSAAACVVTDLTEYKRHEERIFAEALERAKRAEAEAGQRRIASLLESITDSFISVDREWRITEANPRAAANVGGTQDEMVGAAFWDLWPQARFPELAEQCRKAMAERVAVHVEARSSFAPGEWFETHIYPTDDGLAVYFRDVTERKRAEDELRRSESCLAEGQRLSHTGSWAWNVSTGELFWTLEHFRICGVDPETFTLTIESARQLIHPEDRASANQAFDNAIEQQGNFDHEWRIVRPDGTIRHVHGLGHPLLNETGEVTDYVGTIIDITERREAEKERIRLLRQVVQAQEDERRRIAVEMHDQFGQQLSALVLTLSTLKRGLGERTSLGEQLASLEAITRQLDADLELIVSRLRPPALDDLGLIAALEHYVKHWSEHFDIRAEFDASGVEPGRLTGEIDTALYRITQEALNNVAKHARARHVAILLDGRSDRVSLIVEDDGVGFDGEAAGAHERFGVVGMRERAKLLGGSVDIESHSPKGTTVVARIPLLTKPEGRQRHSWPNQ
jgi:PAS domain S-box-containing protein